MKDAIEMARQAGAKYIQDLGEFALVGNEAIKAFEAFVRSDERESIKIICKAEQTDDSADLWNVCCTHLINKINEKNI
jgi:hypothetical protein